MNLNRRAVLIAGFGAAAAGIAAGTAVKQSEAQAEAHHARKGRTALVVQEGLG